jgi:hypothetical protein
MFDSPVSVTLLADILRGVDDTPLEFTLKYQ